MTMILAPERRPVENCCAVCGNDATTRRLSTEARICDDCFRLMGIWRFRQARCNGHESRAAAGFPFEVMAGAKLLHCLARGTAPCNEDNLRMALKVAIVFRSGDWSPTFGEPGSLLEKFDDRLRELTTVALAEWDAFVERMKEAHPNKFGLAACVQPQWADCCECPKYDTCKLAIRI